MVQGGLARGGVAPSGLTREGGAHGERRQVPAPGGDVKTLSWDVEEVADAVHVRMRGELDLASAPDVDRELRRREEEADLLVLDLRRVTFIDSGGLRTILLGTNEAFRAAHRFYEKSGFHRVDGVYVRFDEPRRRTWHRAVVADRLAVHPRRVRRRRDHDRSCRSGTPAPDPSVNDRTRP